MLTAHPPLPLTLLEQGSVPRPRTVVFALGLLVAVSAVGCPKNRNSPVGTLPLITTDNPRAEADMREARERFEQGDHPDAERRLRKFLLDHASDPLAPIAKLTLGRILLEKGKHVDAQRMFDEVSRHRDPSVAEQAEFYGGVTRYRVGKHGEAIRRLAPFVGRTIDPETTELLLVSLSESYFQVGDRVHGIVVLDTLVGSTVPAQRKEAAVRQASTLIGQQASAEEVDRLYNQLNRSGPLWPMAAKRALRESYTAGDLDRVRVIADSLSERGVSIEEELRTMALRAERTDEAKANVIGAIVPLSGRARTVGQEALRGLMLAAGLPSDAPKDGSEFELVFRDDGGDPNRAASAVEDLVSLHRAIAIIGPISGPTAERAAERADELGIPLVTLTPSDKVRTSSMVSRLFMTRSAEMDALLAHVGGSRIAVIHTNDAFGRSILKSVQDQATVHGTKVTHLVGIDPEATAFGEVVQSLGSAQFDAIVFGINANMMMLLAPAMAAGGYWPKGSPRAPSKRTSSATVPWLLPSLAYAVDGHDSSLRYLEGAVVSAPFVPNGTPATKSFSKEFTERYGSEPNIYAAAAYDAFKLLTNTIETGARTRSEVATAIRKARLPNSVGPSDGLKANGTPATGTRLYRVGAHGLVAL